VPVEVPPLRQRTDDLPELCRHLAAKIARRLGRPAATVSEAALALLARHPFPGNVRELENLLERAMVLALARGRADRTLEPDDLRLDTVPGSRAPTVQVPLAGGLGALEQLFAQAEERLIRQALAAWPKLSNREVAERLGTNRRVFELRMKQYGIVKHEPGDDERD